MLVLSQAPAGGAGRESYRVPSSSTSKAKSLLSLSQSTIKPKHKLKSLYVFAVAPKPDGATRIDFTSAPKVQLPNNNNNIPPLPSDTVFVGPDEVPLEGVIQFENTSSSSSLKKWVRVAFLAGGDVLALLLFSAIGRFSQGFPVLDSDTFRTADPFVAGWFLAAYFLGGYSGDGRGMNGMSKAIIAAAKSWALGIPLGVVIRAVTLAKTPSYPFVLVTIGSTAVLLIGWRAISSKILIGVDKKSKRNDDMYRRGSLFELFELLTSLVRRW